MYDQGPLGWLPRSALFAFTAALGLAFAAGPVPARAAEPAAGGATAPPAAGGPALVPAAAAARAVVVGVLEPVRALDRAGRAAELRVERALSGESAADARITIAWEELAESRPNRFAAGDRVLVALEAPSGSLWRSRLADAPALVVAAAGEAFVRDPDAASVEALAGWLALPAAARRSAAALPALAELVAAPSQTFALGALAVLGDVPALGDALAGPAGSAAAARLAALLAAPGREPVRVALVRLAAARGVAALREPIAALAASSSQPPALRGAALEALPALGAPPAPALLEAAYASDAAELRAAAAAADPAPSAARLSRLAARDPSAAVRGAALLRLALLPAQQSLAPILAAFEDPDPQVREAAIRAAAGLGEAAVPALAERALAADAERARPPVAALALAGPAGTAALARVAQDHREEQVRAFARVLLGRPAFPGH